MNSQLWKTALDNLDEDIVNSAAERFGKAKFSGETPADYPADRSPVEYRFTEKKLSKRIGLAVGIGSAAVVALGVGIAAFVRTTTLDDIVLPNSGAVGDLSTTTISSTYDSQVEYIESNNDPIAEENIDLRSGGFDPELFEEYFYGSWVDDGGWTMQLGYSPNEFFGYSSGRIVAGMNKDSNGCYILQQTNEGYDMLFVPQSDPDKLYYYYSVTLTNDGRLPEDFWKSDHEYTTIYTRGGAVSEGNSLGYFGVEKLAEEMGVSAEWLLTQDIQFEGGEADLWIRSSYSNGWDNIILLEQTKNSVTLRMEYFEKNTSEPAFFDVTFARNGGEWEMRSAKTTSDLYFGTEDNQIFEMVSKKGLTLFKQHFHDFWVGESEEYPSFVLLYMEDIFTPAEYCLGIEEVAEGWAMYQHTTEGMKVYYIPEIEPTFMYLYIPDENGFAEPNKYIAKWETMGKAMGYAGSSRISWIGLERYKLHHSDSSEGISLGAVIGYALSEVYGELWSAAYYTADMEGWDGYRISELSENEVLFYFQQFTRDGESRWVCQQIVKTGADWTLGDLRVDITEDELEIAGFYGDVIPIDWSEDWDIEDIESEGEFDGR